MKYKQLPFDKLPIRYKRLLYRFDCSMYDQDENNLVLFVAADRDNNINLFVKRCKRKESESIVLFNAKFKLLLKYKYLSAFHVSQDKDVLFTLMIKDFYEFKKKKYVSYVNPFEPLDKEVIDSILN